MEPATIIVLGLLIVFIASVAQGLTGFGFALIAVPLLSLLLPFDQVVPVVVSLGLITNVLMLFKLYRDVELRKIWLLLVFGFVGIPIGGYMLLAVPANILQLIVSILVLVFAILLLMRISYPIRNEYVAFPFVGLLSGVLNGSISVSGPPLVLFLANQGKDVDVFRSNLVVYGFFLNVFTLGMFAYQGFLNQEVISITLVACIAMALGTGLGMLLAKRVNQEMFKKIVIYLLMGSSIWATVNVFLPGVVHDELKLAKETDHAIIYVRETDHDTTEMVEMISNEFEEHYDRLTSMFQYSPPRKTVIYIYTDKAQFREMIGRDTEGTYDARDQIIKVYTPHDLTREDIRDEYVFQVVHEFVHAIIQQMNPRIGYDKWLDEGIAYFASEQLGDEIESGRYARLPVPQLRQFEDSRTFFDQAGSQAYYFSGLFVQYIYENYGGDKLNQIIRKPNRIEKILDQSFEDVYQEWKASVERRAE